MLLDLTTISADRTPLALEIDGEMLAPSGDDFNVDGPLRLDAELQRKGAGEFAVVGTLAGTLLVPCSRCLEPYALPLSSRVDVRLLPTAALEASEEHEVHDDDLAVEFYHHDQVDVGALVREQCYLALPMKPLCRADCRGLCPQCGTNLNESSCDCDQSWVDPRLAALKALVPERPPE